MSKSWLRGLICGAAVALVGCSGGTVPKYQVRGAVTVNGSPTPLVLVQFHRVGDSVTGRGVTGNAAYPTAVTAEDGSYELTTDKNGDGIYPGEYVVTFMHLSANDPGAFDRFRGAFADPAKSAFRVTIDPRPTDLPPFELKTGGAAARPARRPGGTS
jgi:hypothetical protein